MSKEFTKYMYKSAFLLVLLSAVTPALSSCQGQGNPIPSQPSPAKPGTPPTPKV